MGLVPLKKKDTRSRFLSLYSLPRGETQQEDSQSAASQEEDSHQNLITLAA